MIGRRPWADDRRHRVKLYSTWAQQNDQNGRRWKVTELFHYETGPGDVLSVRIRCSERDRSGDPLVRRMSEARFLQQFIEVR